MATRDVFSAEELEQLRRFPEVDRAELIRYFTLTPADEAFVRQFRGQGNVLGAAVQLCTLPWLGSYPTTYPRRRPRRWPGCRSGSGFRSASCARTAPEGRPVRSICVRSWRTRPGGRWIRRTGRESAAKSKLTEALAERARGGEDRQALLDEILTIVLDPDVGDEQIGVLLRERVGMDRLRAAWAARNERLPRDHGHLAMLDASMSYLRQFAPDVLKAVRFAGSPGTGALLAAVSILTGLYATGTRKVPAGAPVGFVPARYAGYLAASAEAGDVTGYRHYWELCVLLALRDGLRSGDIYVPGSRRYADPASFLLTPGAVGAAAGRVLPSGRQQTHAAGEALAQADDELHTALGELESHLARGADGEVRLTDDGGWSSRR